MLRNLVWGQIFEDMLDGRLFILKTGHKNLTYLNVTLTGKELYLQDKDFHLYHVPGKEVHQFVPDALSRLCENNMPARLEPDQVLRFVYQDETSTAEL